MFRQQVRHGLTEILLTWGGKGVIGERKLLGRIEVALGTALEQGTTEVKAVKIDLLGGLLLEGM